ncbi:MAG TPA: GFA family protein [Gaiellaceae bacterium]|nr:GFA family protein [Gaiellaceae bacterium]
MRTGGCLCGAVRYAVEGEPLHVGRCHCADCRKRSGSAFAIYGHWPCDAFRLEGELADYGGDRFCGRCGSRVGLIEDDLVELNLGTLDDAPFDLVPDTEIWIKRREPWLHAVDGGAQHEESRH